MEYSFRVQSRFKTQTYRRKIHHATEPTSYKVKVKFTLVQALRFCTGRTAHRGSRGIALLFLDHGTRKGWGVSVTPRPLFNPGKDPVRIEQEAGWAPGPVWTGAENLAPTEIRSPDRPARSQSLYRLRYPAPSGNTGQFQRAVQTFSSPLELRSLRNFNDRIWDTLDRLLEGSRGD